MDVPAEVLVAFVAGGFVGWLGHVAYAWHFELALERAQAKRGGNSVDPHQPDAKASTFVSMHAHAITDPETARRRAHDIIQDGPPSPFSSPPVDETRTSIFETTTPREDSRTAFDLSPFDVDREPTGIIDRALPGVRESWDVVDREPSSGAQESPQNVLERACREFLTACDTQDMSCDGAEAWFRQRGLDCVALDTDTDRWHLLMVNASRNPRTGFVVPAMRRSMGSVSLGDYYDLNRYNGLDPLQPRDIATFCTITVSIRKVNQKGSIDVR